MALEEYKRKRNFSKTPEPAPDKEKGAIEAKEPCRYFIQRHDATRLHYDLRLEVDGVLKSWAVPKGPSLDPTQKRLAMEVEDHPLGYGTFEGNIPEGNYGAGSVMLWDRGRFEAVGPTPAREQLAHGELKFDLEGEKLHGGFALIKMKRTQKNEWLLIKHRDESAVDGWNIEDVNRSISTKRTQDEIAADAPLVKSTPSGRAPLAGAVRAAMPEEIEPMKAFLTDSPPEGTGWLYEIKWDGVRALGYVKNEKLKLYSRKSQPITAQYPELADFAKHVNAESAVVDGEIAVVDENGRPEFQLLQPRIMASGKAAIAEAAAAAPVTYYLFDLLYYNGFDLRKCPLIERKELLKSILSNHPRFRYSEHFEDQGKELLAQARKASLEGVIAKKAASLYESKRSAAWLKLKLVQQQEFVICGFTKKLRDTFASLMLGIYRDGKLEYAGNVGTGFNEASLNAIYHKLQPLITARSPFTTYKLPTSRGVTWVKPELVCEIKFAQWTKDSHLRAPVFLGLRPDADPKDCVREVAVPSETTAPPKKTARRVSGR